MDRNVRQLHPTYDHFTDRLRVVEYRPAIVIVIVIIENSQEQKEDATASGEEDRRGSLSSVNGSIMMMLNVPTNYCAPIFI